MRVLIVGAGGVGAAFASIAARRPVFTDVVLADIDGNRAARAADRANAGTSRLGISGERVRSTRVDASDAG